MKCSAHLDNSAKFGREKNVAAWKCATELSKKIVEGMLTEEALALAFSEGATFGREWEKREQFVLELAAK